MALEELVIYVEIQENGAQRNQKLYKLQKISDTQQKEDIDKDLRHKVVNT
jgi:hypothetical protein